MGGFLRLAGRERDAISGPHTGLARHIDYRELGKNGGIFDMPSYLGGSVEAGNAWQNRSEISVSSTIVYGSLFAGLDTFLDRVFLAAGFSEQEESSFYLYFGNPVL